MAGSIETHRDIYPLFQGTHKGSSGSLTLRDPGACFLSAGATVGNAIYNDTDSSNGLITAITEDEVTCTLSGGTNNTWTYGDTYKIYATTAYNTKISSWQTDRRAGHKVTRKEELTEEGYLPEDVDMDQDDDNVFGPGQPIRRYKG